MPILVCLGDQMIANEAEQDGTPRLTSRIRNRLRDWTVINSGSDNETVTTSLFRFQDDVLRYNPDIVVISFGLTKEQFSQPLDLLEVEKNLLIMIQKVSSDKTILVTPIPSTNYLYDNERRYVNAYAKIVRKVSERTNCALVDVWEELKEKKDNMNRQHSNLATINYSHILLTKLIVNKINEITKERTAK